MNFKEAIDKIKALLSQDEVTSAEVVAEVPEVAEVVVDETPAEVAPVEVVEDAPVVEAPAETAVDVELAAPAPPAPAPVQQPAPAPAAAPADDTGARVQALEQLVSQIVDKLNKMEGVKQQYATQRQAVTEILYIVEKLAALPSVEPTPVKDSNALPKRDRSDLVARLVTNIDEVKKNLNLKK